MMEVSEMTHEEKMELARTLGRLDSAITWLEVRRDVALERIVEESDPTWIARYETTAAIANDSLPVLREVQVSLEETVGVPHRD